MFRYILVSVLSLSVHAQESKKFKLTDINIQLGDRAAHSITASIPQFMGASIEGYGDAYESSRCGDNALTTAKSSLNQEFISNSIWQSVLIELELLSFVNPLTNINQFRYIVGPGVARWTFEQAKLAYINLFFKYLDSNSPKDFLVRSGEWVVGETVAGKAPKVFANTDNVTSQVAQGVYRAWTSGKNVQLLNFKHRHGKCGDVFVSYSLVPGAKPQFRLFVTGDCNGEVFRNQKKLNQFYVVGKIDSRLKKNASQPNRFDLIPDIKKAVWEVYAHCGERPEEPLKPEKEEVAEFSKAYTKSDDKCFRAGESSWEKWNKYDDLVIALQSQLQKGLNKSLASSFLLGSKEVELQGLINTIQMLTHEIDWLIHIHSKGQTYRKKIIRREELLVRKENLENEIKKMKAPNILLKDKAKTLEKSIITNKRLRALYKKNLNKEVVSCVKRVCSQKPFKDGLRFGNGDRSLYTMRSRARLEIQREIVLTYLQAKGLSQQCRYPLF